MVGDGAFDLGDEGGGRDGVEEGAAEEAVLHHVAHGAFLDFGVVEFEDEGGRAFARASVGHLDLEDGLRVRGDLGPDAEDLEEPLGGEGEGVAAAIEFAFGGRRAERGPRGRR